MQRWFLSWNIRIKVDKQGLGWTFQNEENSKFLKQEKLAIFNKKAKVEWNRLNEGAIAIGLGWEKGDSEGILGYCKAMQNDIRYDSFLFKDHPVSTMLSRFYRSKNEHTEVI